MRWYDYYTSRIVSAPEAVKCIKSGNRVILGHACSEPQALVEAMVARADSLCDVEIVHRVAKGKALYVQPGMEKSFRHNGFFLGPNTRQAFYEDRADYTPAFISETPGFFTERVLPLDVALVTVSPPDAHGYVSLGINVDYTLAAVKSADIVLAEVNPNMPRTYGRSFIKVDEIDYFIPSDRSLIINEPLPIGEIEKEIGSHVASLIPNGATMQMGIGGIPDAVLTFLGNKADLGIHTEMFSDGVIPLVENGVINCKRKTLHPDKIVSTFIMGTSKIYKWVHENPIIEMHPEEYVNDPFVIMRHDNMISINSALEVDLLGQVAADTLGPRQFSGVGGQVDFIRGAARSRGGKSIIALPSTAAKGTLSRIVAGLKVGTAVTTSRHDVDYVVTEYGIAHLKGKTVKARMEALISIAHPDFRQEIRDQAKALYYV